MKRLLVVKIAAIGDVVMALPILEELRSNFPASTITWVCGKSVRPLLELAGGVDEIITVDESELLSGPLMSKVASLMRIWRKLFLRKFDLTVIGHADPRYRLLASTIISKERRSFSRSEGRLFPVPGRHHSDEYVRLARGEENSLDKKACLPGISNRLPDIAGLLPAGEDRSPAVALAPGGAKNVLSDDSIRRWPLAHYVGLAQALLKRGCKVILTGGPTDKWVCEDFSHLPVIDLVGKTTLPELVALYRSCNVVVAHDSGPLHLAGLAGVPIVALFGPTNPYEKVPRDERSAILWKKDQLSCCPCYDGKYYSVCSSKKCLEAITITEVYDAINTILCEYATKVIWKEAL